MSFITIQRHWDVLEYEATHKLRYDHTTRDMNNHDRLLVKGTLVHLKSSKKETDGRWMCIVLTPKVGKRGYVLKSGADVWLLNLEVLERL